MSKLTYLPGPKIRSNVWYLIHRSFKNGRLGLLAKVCKTVLCFCRWALQCDSSSVTTRHIKSAGTLSKKHALMQSFRTPSLSKKESGVIYCNQCDNKIRCAGEYKVIITAT